MPRPASSDARSSASSAEPRSRGREPGTVTIWRIVAPDEPGSEPSRITRSASWSASSTSWVTRQDGRRCRGVDVEQEVLHLQPGQGVQRPERLIEQQHPWIAGEGTRQRRSLGHAARHLAGPMVGEARSGRPGRAVARRDRGRQPPPSRAGRPSATLPARVRHGRSRGSWKANAHRGSMPVTGSPPIVTAPVVGVSRPAVIRRSVDLPHPLMPRITTTSPGWTESEMSRRTTWSVSRAVRSDVRANVRPRPRKSTSCLVSDPVVRLGGVPRRSAGGESMDTRARSWSVLVAWAVPIRGGVGGWPWVPGTQKSRSPSRTAAPGPASGPRQLSMTRPIALCPLHGAARAYTSRTVGRARSWRHDTKPSRGMSTDPVGLPHCDSASFAADTGAVRRSAAQRGSLSVTRVQCPDPESRCRRTRLASMMGSEAAPCPEIGDVARVRLARNRTDSPP